MQLNYCIHCFAPLQAPGACPHCGFDRTKYIPQPHHLPPETILHGKYLVGRVLGEGGFGITYIGMDLVLERKIAIKEYFPGGSVWRDSSTGLSVTSFTSQSNAESFELGKQNCMREAKSLAKLDDIDSVVRVLDHFLENNTAYVIMEYVNGTTLKDYVRTLQSRMTFPQAMQMMMPIMRALDTVHRRGFIHRDISPDNIMLTPDGKAKLLDFGAVKAVSRGGTSTENPVVKRGFSPLEQYSTEGHLGPWTDVYAICATLFYLLTGQTVSEPMERLNDDSRTEALLRGVVPDKALPVLMQGLAVRYQYRTQTMGELIGQLNSLMPKQDAAPKWVRHLKWMLPLAAALMIAMVAVVFGLMKTPDAAKSTKNYTYGRELENMLSDGIAIYSSDFLYFSDCTEGEIGGLYRWKPSDESESIEKIAPYSYYLNILGDTLYFIQKDDLSIYRLAPDDEAPVKLVQTQASVQLLAVDTGKNHYLYYSELTGGKVYIRRYDIDTEQIDTITSAQEGILYMVHDGMIYYVNADGEVWTVNMDGSQESCLFQDLKVNALAFDDEYIYLQTDSEVVKATLKGKRSGALKGVNSLYNRSNIFDDSYISPILIKNGTLYYVNSADAYMYAYDLKTEKKELYVEADCFDYEFHGSQFLYTTWETQTPTIHIRGENGESWPVVLGARMNVETYVASAEEHPENVLNGTFAVRKEDANAFYAVSKGSLYKITYSEEENTTYYKQITNTNNGATCNDLVVLEDGTLYAITRGNGYSAIDTSRDNGKLIYRGADIHNLQYLQRDETQRLFFTDKDEDGNYYAYSVDLNGESLLRLSHVPCAPDSLVVSGRLISYLDASRTTLFVAYYSGQAPEKVYTVTEKGSTIVQAALYFDFFLVSQRDSAGQHRLLAMDLNGEIEWDKVINVAQFALSGDYLFGIDPNDSALYRYDYKSLTDNSQNKRVKISPSGVKVDVINAVQFGEHNRIFYRTPGGIVYLYLFDNEEEKTINVSAEIDKFTD